MERTPDNVKKGLEYSFKSCWTALELGDPLGYPQAVISAYEAMGNALDLIQQLQAENAEKDERIRVLESRNNALYHTILGVMHFVDKWIDDAPAYDPDEDLNGTTAIGRASQAREIALQAIEQLQAERDAAVADLEHVKDCDSCKYDDACFTGKKDCFGCHEKRCPCLTCQYEWRGVQKEE